MSAKTDKKIRQKLKREVNGKAEEIVNAMCAQPLAIRLKIARRIILGHGTDKMRVRAVKLRNKAVKS